MLLPDDPPEAPDTAETPADRLLQAIALMADGFAIKRAQLRLRHPDADGDALNALFEAWLTADDR